MINRTCVESGGGITYITVGTAGATFHNETLFANQTSFVRSYLPEWGWGRVTVANASAMHWEFVANNDTSHGAVKDDVWFYQ